MVSSEDRERDNESIQLAENKGIGESETNAEEYNQKRMLLEKTEIVKQSWSIREIYQKINGGTLILDPKYQRQEIWNSEKQTAFIESLFMRIAIPPIYVVEMQTDDLLDGKKYEVVDGKQRLTAIKKFMDDENSSKKFVLNPDYLEYYRDIFGGKSYKEIARSEREITSKMLSSVLDVYVITENSPEFTKYDIFARLNKGAEKLRVNEIRRAVYKSHTTDYIDEYLFDEQGKEKSDYKSLFSKNERDHYEDYGRMYRSISFFIRSDIGKCEVQKYNSRPRDMINDVLGQLRKDNLLSDEKIANIIDITIKLKRILGSKKNSDYLIDSLIPFIDKCDVTEYVERILTDENIQKTLERSPGTTKNVNKRLLLIKSLVMQY